MFLVSCQPLTSLDAEIGQAAKRHCETYAKYAETENDLKRSILKTSLPHCDVSKDESCSDKLEQVSSIF